jgi:hypothetical protein
MTGSLRVSRGSLLGLLVAVLMATGLASPAGAASDFTPGPYAYTVDTTTMTIKGPGYNIGGTSVGGVAVFQFRKVDIPPGAVLNVEGSRPLKIVASSTLNMGGFINGNGQTASDFTQGPNAGGPGGGAGGRDHLDTGDGPGGGGVGGDGGPGTGYRGAGGGGFGGRGARGGDSPSPVVAGAAGGPKYGNLNLKLQGGSGGGGSVNTGGGGGGGAIALFGSTVTIPGIVQVNGGAGDIANSGGSGGGSGGGILIHGNSVNVTGTLSAKGGDGGAGGCCGAGGGGGGGRIAYQYKTLVASGTTVVTGGASGASDGPGNVGIQSPDPTGLPGVVTMTGVPNTSITSSTINPSTNRASFAFKAVPAASATSFQCALKKGTQSAPFKPCSSPKTYTGLANGSYTFLVRAVGPSGTDATPARKSFSV